MSKSCLSSVGLGVVTRWVALCACALASSAVLAQVPQSGSVSKPVKKASQSRAELKTQANQMAAGARAAEEALSPAELSIAERVEVGRISCEMGQSVTIAVDPKLPGYFDISVKKFRFRMVPVVSSTGAIRLEDNIAGAVWLQLANKSMLMSQKLGIRLADACMTPAQATFAAAMEKSPPPSLLDSPLAVDLSSSTQAQATHVSTVQ
ncbi:hypothetical protein MIZ03_3473 [Rhodoferax lithotrophicus]|uniref:Uncharacterized protein n=2 Tax=Rhodoferax lithotrophicus TaxID=2798804 RepID=A0ABN6DCA5_9BURK|nr:hypothetical protein MIZ03_3473 [Rhodoferax sp. MIZ03]